VQGYVVIAVIAVGHRTVVPELRSEYGDAESGQHAGCVHGEAVFLIRASFGEHVDLRLIGRRARHEIDHSAIGVGSVDRGLRPFDDLHALQKIGGNEGEIESAADRVYGDAVDLHQVEIVIAAADEHTGSAAGGTGLADGDARQVP
jgi:hypothetical protein